MKRLFLSLLLLCSSVMAEPINIVVPVSPGGNIDMFARTLSKYLMENNINNIVTYHTGASGDIAYTHVMNKHDNVIMVAATGNFVLSHVFQNRDNFYATTMTFVAPMAEAPPSFVTGTKGYANFKAMIKDAKNNVVMCGVSSANALELYKINQEYGTHFEAVPYKGTAQLKMDLLGNQIQCGYDGTGAYIPDHQTEKLKILASVKSITPGVTTMNTVLPGYYFTSWFGVGIPNGSNLLENPSFVNLLIKFRSQKDVADQLLSSGILLSNPDPGINAKMVQQTAQYKTFLK